MVELLSRNGVWRSLVARFFRDEEAVGSNPATPTIGPTLKPAPRCLRGAGFACLRGLRGSGKLAGHMEVRKSTTNSPDSVGAPETFTLKREGFAAHPWTSTMLRVANR